MESGTAITYSLDKLRDRGKFFINPGEDVYVGMIIARTTDRKTSWLMSPKPRSSQTSGLPALT